MNNDNKNKYLDDEQVKKNMELFNNDRENFLKKANQIEYGNLEKTINLDENIDNQNEHDDEIKNINFDKIIIIIDIIIIGIIMSHCIYICYFVEENTRCGDFMGLLGGPCGKNDFPIITFLNMPFLLLFILGDKTKEKILEIIAVIILICINLFTIIATIDSKNIIYQISTAYFLITVLILINTLFFRTVENKINMMNSNKDNINRTGNQ